MGKAEAKNAAQAASSRTGLTSADHLNSAEALRSSTTGYGIFMGFVINYNDFQDLDFWSSSTAQPASEHRKGKIAGPDQVKIATKIYGPDPNSDYNLTDFHRETGLNPFADPSLWIDRPSRWASRTFTLMHRFCPEDYKQILQTIENHNQLLNSDKESDLLYLLDLVSEGRTREYGHLNSDSDYSYNLALAASRMEAEMFYDFEIAKINQAYGLHSPLKTFEECQTVRNKNKIALIMLLDQIDTTNYSSVAKAFQEATDKALKSQEFKACMETAVPLDYIKDLSNMGVDFNSVYDHKKFDDHIQALNNESPVVLELDDSSYQLFPFIETVTSRNPMLFSDQDLKESTLLKFKCTTLNTVHILTANSNLNMIAGRQLRRKFYDDLFEAVAKAIFLEKKI